MLSDPLTSTQDLIPSPCLITRPKSLIRDSGARGGTQHGQRTGRDKPSSFTPLSQHHSISLIRSLSALVDTVLSPELSGFRARLRPSLSLAGVMVRGVDSGSHPCSPDKSPHPPRLRVLLHTRGPQESHLTSCRADSVCQPRHSASWRTVRANK